MFFVCLFVFFLFFFCAVTRLTINALFLFIYFFFHFYLSIFFFFFFQKLRFFSAMAVVVVRIFNATRHPRHIEAAAISIMYMYLFSLASMDHSCTLGAAVCHQAPPCPLYTQPRARQVWARRTNGLKIVSTRAGFEPTISRLKVECTNH